MTRDPKSSNWLLAVVAVVVIGGLLVALLLPALQSAREAARRSTNVAYDWDIAGEDLAKVRRSTLGAGIDRGRADIPIHQSW